MADASAHVAVVESGYATLNKLKAGSTVNVDGTNFTVIGIVSMPQGSATVDVFIPLAPAQALSGMKNEGGNDLRSRLQRRGHRQRGHRDLPGCRRRPSPPPATWPAR